MVRKSCDWTEFNVGQIFRIAENKDQLANVISNITGTSPCYDKVKKKKKKKNNNNNNTVSYTHLDVYKRQCYWTSCLHIMYSINNYAYGY